jgi:hypothetical protein
MAQTFNMRRLHMGCGESLRRDLPLLVYGKRPLLPPLQTGFEHNESQETKRRKPQPEESH